MEIRWIASASASGFYAVGQMLRGRTLVDGPLADAIEASAMEIVATASTWQIEPVELVDQLAAVSAEPLSAANCASIVARKVVGLAAAPQLATSLASWIGDVERAFAEVHPLASDELELRGAPLREQWEARGPGLMKATSRIIGEPLVEAAEVLLVQPVLGGGGVGFPMCNRICFEALLANPFGDLPEVVRLGWLLGQLQLDRPDWQGTLTRARTMDVGLLALIPVVLAAAVDVELVTSVEAALPRALAAWHQPVEQAETLSVWWETFRASKLPWPAALTALDHMLGPPLSPQT